MSEIVNTTLESYSVEYGYSDEIYGTFVEESFELPLVIEIMLFWHIFAMSIIGAMFYMTKDI